MQIRFHAHDRYGHPRFRFETEEKTEDMSMFRDANDSALVSINLPDGPARFRVWDMQDANGIMHIWLVRAVPLH